MAFISLAKWRSSTHLRASNQDLLAMPASKPFFIWL